MRKITCSVKVALKWLIAVVLVDVDLPYWTSKDEHIAAFTAIFNNICTAHAEIFMNLRCMAGHVTNLATKLEDPMPIPS